jgi:hypothetical protein
MTRQAAVRIALILCCIVVFGSIPLSAQIVVPYPVITGMVTQAPEFQTDAADFYENIVIELNYQGSVVNAFTVMETATLAPVPTIDSLPAVDQAARPHYAVTMHLEKINETMSSFTLRVWDLVATAYPYTEYTTSYEDPQEVLSTIPFSVWQITSVLPVNYTYPDDYVEGGGSWGGRSGVGQMDENAWKTSWLYLGLQAGISMRIYTIQGDQSMGTAFTPGIRAEFQAAAFQWLGSYFAFSLQTVLSFGQETVIFRSDNATSVRVEYKSYSLTLPLFFKLSFKPDRFLIGPYVGAYFILPLGDSASYSLPLGWSLGLELGLHAGPGILFLDANYSADLGESVFKDAPRIPYRRTIISVSLGYSFGLIRRN